MRFAVFGAGYTGQRVARQLVAFDVIAFTRSPEAEQQPPAERLERRTLDLDLPLEQQTAAAISLPAPCTVLYTIPPDGNDTDQRLPRLLDNIDGHLERFVYLSTTGVYGNCNGALVTEDDPAKPATERAKRRLSAEQQLQSWCERRNTTLVILRVPGIYGPGRLGIERIAAGDPSLCEADATPGNRIHVDDLAACCVSAMQGPAAGGIYNVGDGSHNSSTWFRKTTAEIAGLAAPPEITLAQARQTFNRQRLSFLTESRRIDTRKMREALRFTPQYEDATDGIRASLEHAANPD